MAEARLFSFTLCVEHSPAHCNFQVDKYAIHFRQHSNVSPCNFHPEKYDLANREFMTFSVTTFDFKSKKSLEERKAEVARITKKHPDRIPVILLLAEESQMPCPRLKTLIEAKRNLGEFFISIWKILHVSEIMSKTYSSISTHVEHKNPIFEKLMSSVYEEYKDEDGCLYITITGKMRDVLLEPIPSNIRILTSYKPLKIEKGDTLDKFAEEWNKLVKDQGERLAELKRRQYEEKVNLDKELDAELARLMDKNLQGTRTSMSPGKGS